MVKRKEVMSLDEPEIDDYCMISEILKTLQNLQYVLNPLNKIIIEYLMDITYIESTKDETRFVVCRAYLKTHSVLMKQRLETCEPCYFFNIDSYILELFALYVSSHKLADCPIISKPLKSACFADSVICKFDVWIADVFDSKPNMLYDAIEFMNYIDCKSLLHLLCGKVASKIKAAPTGQVATHIKLTTIVDSKNIPNCECPFH